MPASLGVGDDAAPRNGRFLPDAIHHDARGKGELSGVAISGERAAASVVGARGWSVAIRSSGGGGTLKSAPGQAERREEARKAQALSSGGQFAGTRCAWWCSMSFRPQTGASSGTPPNIAMSLRSWACRADASSGFRQARMSSSVTRVRPRTAWPTRAGAACARHR